MRNLIIVVCFLLGAYHGIQAQNEVAKAAEEACSCMKELDPEKQTQRELNMEMLGCASRAVNGIAEAMKAKNAWADSMAFTYLGKVGKETRTLCPEQYQRLKKKEVAIDPALLAIKPESELLPGYSKAVCNCLTVIKDVDECMKKVGSANEEEIKRRFPNSDAFSAMMGITMDVMFDLADHCDAAGTNATIAKLKQYPAITEGCSKAVAGEFSVQSMLGETRSKFTANTLQEFSDGKLTAEYSLKWSGCTVTTTCTTTHSDMVKKGEVTNMEIRRASDAGFIAFVSLGKMKVPVFYNKVK